MLHREDCCGLHSVERTVWRLANVQFLGELQGIEISRPNLERSDFALQTFRSFFSFVLNAVQSTVIQN